MLPKRVGLPKAKPAHSLRSLAVTYGVPLSGTLGCVFSMVVEIFGTVLNLALAPEISFIPLAI